MNLLLISGGSSESDLSDSDSVFGINSGADCDAGIHPDSGVDYGAESGVDSGANFGTNSGAKSGADSGIGSGIDSGIGTSSEIRIGFGIGIENLLR